MENPVLEVLRSHSLSSVLQHEIERMILDGSFKSGDWLNENALATRFKVSRGPVREACRALAQRGLVEIIPNRGVFIRRMNPPEAEECYDLRSGLFSLAARVVAERITEEQLATLSDLLVEMDTAAERQSLSEYDVLNRVFHSNILNWAGNARLTDTYLGIIKELHLFRPRGLLHSGALTASNAEHREIVSAFVAGDPVRASEAAFRHIQNAKRRMLSFRDETALNQQA